MLSAQLWHSQKCSIVARVTGAVSARHRKELAVPVINERLPASRVSALRDHVPGSLSFPNHGPALGF